MLFLCSLGLHTRTSAKEIINNTCNDSIVQFTDVMRYRIIPQEEAVEFFVKEPLHNQLTQLSLDLSQGKKGTDRSAWLEKAKQSFYSPTSETQHFVDSIAQTHTATLKALGLKLPVGNEMKYIDMNMDIFSGAGAFTSGTRIYCDFRKMMPWDKKRPGFVSYLMWHELWHVISRNNPKLRKQMYSLIGFTVLPDTIDLPAEIRPHILLNPDVERHDSYATFTVHGQPTDCMVLLYADVDEYKEGTTLHNYISSTDGYWLLALDKTTHKPFRGADGKWVIYNCTEASDFNNVMSAGNTQYCDDPEECMADNFALAIMSNTDVPNQKLLQNIISKLKE